MIAKVINCKQKINELLTTTVSSIPTSTTSPAPPPPSAVSVPSKPRLSKLTLPKVKEDVKDWHTLWDSFQLPVHNNTDISRVDKFNYLNSLLEGTAFKTVQGLPLTDCNYDMAVEMLKERFGDPQQIISAHA